MKRVAEKVKDIVEIHPFTHLHDFEAEPALTLAGYHFTDITADLMAKWIDRIAGLKSGQGATLALAGFRGVGKSHFLSVIGALISNPELRAGIADHHVAASVNQLSRRHTPVAFVRRGSGASLLDEIKNAIAKVLNCHASSLTNSLGELLLKASQANGDLPLVLLIDTALDRNSRVSRDDGSFLSQVADVARELGIFVGVALDDDISGADGPNSSISASFTIDYLDQEHLYKIVDRHIFSKYPQKLPVLHEIYEYYRTVMPGFRWSEQRFTALYPLHPATLEIAPLIRLYIHDFALLGFASEAGVKILGRPANSLIGLDEVFDAVEKKLRSAIELEDAFEAFDRIEREVIANAPVAIRLPAKLILKGLLLLSLSGQSSTAADIAASMMIFNEQQSERDLVDVSFLLNTFADALPEAVHRASRDQRDAKYCLKIAAGNDIESILDAAAAAVPDDVVWKTLIRLSADKFSDVESPADLETHPTYSGVEWRGALRRGAVVWNRDEAHDRQTEFDQLDWRVVVVPGERPSDLSSSDTAAQTVVWNVAEPTADEKDTIRRHYLLQTDPEMRERAGDGVTTAMHVHLIATEKIWQRLFLEKGKLLANGTEYTFGPEAASAHTLAHLLTFALAPTFEVRYPEHPVFVETLGVKQVSALIANFFGGKDPYSADMQALAATFALPLGIAERHGDVFAPAPAEVLLDLPVVRSSFSSVHPNDGVTPVADLSMQMRCEPAGLTREARHLILAALVAQRQFEFITSSGNRINHRSLDLQIIWDDIVGMAKPLEEQYSDERLLFWAKLLTGDPTLKGLEGADGLLIITSLAEWLAAWRADQALDRFDALPDETLSASIWRTASNLRKTFGAMADIIGSLGAEDQPLPLCLQNIADLFSDSEAEFLSKKKDLDTLGEFTAGASLRMDLLKYLAVCEVTGDPDIEKARTELLNAAKKEGAGTTTVDLAGLASKWSDFRTRFSAHYAEQHDRVMHPSGSNKQLDEIFRSDLWAGFASFSTIAGLDDQQFAARANRLVREIRQLHCDTDPREALGDAPYCKCSFRLSDAGRLTDLPQQLNKLFGEGLVSFASRLALQRDALIKAIDSETGDVDSGSKAALAKFLRSINTKEPLPVLSSIEMRKLRRAAEQIRNSPAPDRKPEKIASESFSDLMNGDVDEWIDSVAKVDAFVETEV